MLPLLRRRRAKFGLRNQIRRAVDVQSWRFDQYWTDPDPEYRFTPTLLVTNVVSVTN